MLQTADNFATLLERSRHGDRAALAALAEQYEPKLRLVARVLLGPALRPYFDSMDLVQSVHRSLLIGLRQDKFDISSPEKLLALALTMVRRKVARHWRHLQRQQRLSGAAACTGNLPHLLASLACPQQDPAQAAQFADQVQQLCANLSDVDRKLLQLRAEGYTPAEIAQELQLSAVAFRVRLTRLRQRLRVANLLDDWL